jgi:integrase
MASPKSKEKKTKRNANGEGTIYERKDGRWCGTATTGRNTDGSLKRKYLYGSSRNEVYKKMVELQRNMHLNDGYIKSENMTLKQWGSICLFDYIKPTIRPGTFQRKESVYRVHISEDNIGTMKLKDIKPYHMQRFLNNKTMDLVDSSIKKIYELLNQFFKLAISNDLLWKNPMDNVIVPRSNKNSKELQVFSRDEQKKYMASLEDEKLKALYLTALFTGMREGELVALKWNNIDLKKNIISVVESYEHVKIFDDPDDVTKYHYETVAQPPKTKAGKRKIPIPEMLVDVLRKHRIQQKEMGMKRAGSSFNKTGLAFCTTVGTPLRARNVMRKHQVVCDKAEVTKITFHELRRTFATRMFEEGADIKQVQYWMGHSTIDISLSIYILVTEDQKIATANKQNELFKSLTT